MDDLFGLLDACRVTSRRSAGNGKRECSRAADSFARDQEKSTDFFGR